MPPLLPSTSTPLALLRHPLELRSLLPSLHHLAPRLPSPDAAPLPTRTTPISHTLASLLQRQTTVTTTANPIIPATYSGIGHGPPAGTVVGIVFGSVAGFLLLLWLIYTCFGLGGGPVGQSSIVEEEVIRRHETTRRTRSSRRSSPRRAVTASVSESEHIVETVQREVTPPPRRSSSRREPDTIIIEETITRAPRSHAAPSHAAPEEFIEVIEEHDALPRRSKKPSGIRHIDPEAYGGGDGRFKRMSSRRD